MSDDYANLPLTPIGIPPEAVAARPDTRALHIGPPDGVSDDDCGTVEALVGQFGPHSGYADYWRPDAEQLEVLNAGGFIELVQYAPRMVMHMLSVWPVEQPEGWSRGSWMQTYTGRRFYPLDPKVEDIDALDIAHALSMICRYGGHAHRFYSVAEHCVLLSYAVHPDHALWALLHDATEAYVGDMVRPLKHHIPAYRAIEDRLMLVIAEKYGLVGAMPDEVKAADNRILLDERAAILGTPPHEWTQDGLEPLGVDVEGWSPLSAERTYLERLRELTE